MNAGRPAPEVTEALASIERQRLGKERQLGMPASCGWALRELYGLLSRGRLAPETGIEGVVHPNVVAATGAIERLRRLARVNRLCVTVQKRAAAKLMMTPDHF